MAVGGALAGVGGAEMQQCRPLDFAWAKRRWTDPLTGTDVVRLSPDERLHFRNPYFRIPMFTRDGEYGVLWGYPEPRTDESGIWSINLRTGETRIYSYGGPGAGGRRVGGLSSYATSYHSHMLHVLVRTEQGVEIEQIDLDSGSRRAIVPSRPMPSIYDATASTGDRFVYTPLSHKSRPEGMGTSEYVAWMGVEPGPNEMYRIDLQSGAVGVVFETDRFWIGHPNPNPVRADLLMCCQEGFNWTEKHPKPTDFSRVRLYHLDSGEFTLFPEVERSRPAHEIWSANGERIWTHGWPPGHHCISKTDVASGKTTTYMMKNPNGRTAHVHPAPNERFVVGDGTDFGKNNQAEIEELVRSGKVDDPWAWEGYGSDSPGEVIWKYELPKESFFGERAEWTAEGIARAIDQNPKKSAKAVPLCQFRSMARVLRKPMRNESNAHVTPDSRWAVFQSASEDGLYEVWVARVPGEQ
jgi:hypothetical protein